MKKKYLLTPGPTPVPKEALDAMALPIIHHRTPEFQAILKEAIEGLKYVFQTKNDVLIFASSGTGAMEASVAGLLSPGDKAIVVRGGKFGERWEELCRAYGVIPVMIDVVWGKAVDPEIIEAGLKKDSSIKAVYTTLCETSTGVEQPIKEIAKIVSKTNAVLVVDAISGLGAVELKTDEWGVDAVVAGSQKGLMLPPGLAFMSLSEKAWNMVETSKSPKYYFNLKAYKKVIAKPDTPYTPAVSLIVGLNEALKLIKKEGLENVLARHAKLSSAIKAAAKALGLELLAPDAASNAVTAIKLPEGLDGAKLVKTMRERDGVGIAGGQAALKGKIIRIASMGYIQDTDIMAGLECLEKNLAEMGYKFEKGIGIKAAKEVLQQ